MSNSNFTAKLLGITDVNINFSNEISEITKKNKRYNVLHATLTYVPKACSCCGSINEDYSIIKNGTKASSIKLLPANGTPTYLLLRKQRFYCKSCGSTFTARTDIVEKNCFISKYVKFKILEYLADKVSEKDIAKHTDVSHSTVSKIIDKSFKAYHPARQHLPKHLLFDEFKSTKDANGKMSFIYVDADTHEIIDIVESRKKHKLIRYFQRFPRHARENVKSVCMDIYSPYIEVVKEMFPNARIIIDRFHIVQLLSRSLNKTRINTMKRFPAASMEYKRLKDYWQLILKAEGDVNRTDFGYHNHFREWVSMHTIVRTSIAVDDCLVATYEAYQALLYIIKRNDLIGLKHQLERLPDTNISPEMKTAIRTLKKYFRYIENTLSSFYSNGTIEGLNNYIKVIKRVAFGYKSFHHFRNRILIARKIMIPAMEGFAA